jgi:hypothetical protein
MRPRKGPGPCSFSAEVSNRGNGGAGATEIANYFCRSMDTAAGDVQVDALAGAPARDAHPVSPTSLASLIAAKAVA